MDQEQHSASHKEEEGMDQEQHSASDKEEEGLIWSFVEEHDAAEANIKEMDNLHQTIRQFINNGSSDETRNRRINMLHHWMYQYMGDTGMLEAAKFFQRDAGLQNPEIPRVAFNLEGGSLFDDLNIKQQPGLQHLPVLEHPQGMPFQHQSAPVAQYQDQNVLPDDIRKRQSGQQLHPVLEHLQGMPFQYQSAPVAQYQDQNVLPDDIRKRQLGLQLHPVLEHPQGMPFQHQSAPVAQYQDQYVLPDDLRQVPQQHTQKPDLGVAHPQLKPYQLIPDGVIFEKKELSLSDVGGTSSSAALSIPRKKAAKFTTFPKIPNGHIVEAMDETGETWELHLIHNDTKSSFNLRKDWGRYVRTFQLREKCSIRLEYIGGRLYVFSSPPVQKEPEIHQ